MPQPPNPQTPQPDKPVKKETRFPVFTLLIGTNGTGKTTVLKKMVAAELKKPDSHVLIITPDDSEWLGIPEVHAQYPERMQEYKGCRKIIVTASEAEQVLNNIRTYFKRGLLIFDDCRAYFKPSTSAILETIFVRRRQMMIDIAAVGHGFSKIPPAFFAYTTHICMFKTTDPASTRKDRFDDIKRWEDIQQRINSKAVTDIHYHEIHKI